MREIEESEKNYKEQILIYLRESYFWSDLRNFLIQIIDIKYTVFSNQPERIFALIKFKTEISFILLTLKIYN